MRRAAAYSCAQVYLKSTIKFPSLDLCPSQTLALHSDTRKHIVIPQLSTDVAEKGVITRLTLYLLVDCQPTWDSSIEHTIRPFCTTTFLQKSFSGMRDRGILVMMCFTNQSRCLGDCKPMLSEEKWKQEHIQHSTQLSRFEILREVRVTSATPLHHIMAEEMEDSNMCKQ